MTDLKKKIRQVGFLSRNHGNNSCTVVFEDGEFKDVDIPEDIKEKFIRFGIDNPYVWRHN